MLRSWKRSSIAPLRLARRTQRLLERLVLARAEGGTVGSTHATRLELSRPIEDHQFDARVERLLCSAELDGELLARVELPVCDRFVASSVLSASR